MALIIIEVKTTQIFVDNAVGGRDKVTLVIVEMRTTRPDNAVGGSEKCMDVRDKVELVIVYC